MFKEYSNIVKVLKSGGLVVFPSDSVYGLAVDPLNPKAVAKLIAFKDRWPGKAISVAVNSLDMAKKYAKIDTKAENIFKTLLPGPFTVIVPGLHLFAPGIEAENGTIGLRLPKYQFITDLVTELGSPITATSANLSGKTPHYSIPSLLKTLSAKKQALIDLIVDHGQLPKNQPSTVIDISQPEPQILRAGDILVEAGTKFVSQSEADTRRLAQFIFQKITPDHRPIVFLLTGDLGGGKTVFSQSIGKYLGVKDQITSPTFVILNQYPATLVKQFLHFDLYRLSAGYEFDEIKFLDHFQPQTVSCIEWPEIMNPQDLKTIRQTCQVISVSFSYLSQNKRLIEYSF